MDEHWTGLDLKDLDGDEDEKKWRAFVRVLERAVGVDLEGNADNVKVEVAPD